jgi:small GTP-binding protein
MTAVRPARDVQISSSRSCPAALVLLEHAVHKTFTRSVPLTRTRNIGIMAHVDAGKTTTTERILYYAGVTSRLGEVDEGSTVTDWMEQEQERGISITAAATTFTWNHHVVNLIDTPGHVDFTMEVERSLRVLDGAIAVFDAVEGVQSQSETVWRQADRYRIPRIAFINKCDREGADPARVLASIKARLGASPIAIQLPLGLGPALDEPSEAMEATEGGFDGVVDLITMRARRWDAASFGVTFTDGPIPDDQVAAASRARDAMIEGIAELDDELMAAWVAGHELSHDAIRAALRRVTLGNRGVPALLGAAFRNLGIHNLLDAILDYLPSPADVTEVRGRDPRDPTGAPTLVRRLGERGELADTEPLAALAFKVQSDEAGGTLTFVRVYAGCLRAGDAVLNATKGHLTQIGRLVRMFANHREDIKQIEAGMIGAVHDPAPVTEGNRLLAGQGLRASLAAHLPLRTRAESIDSGPPRSKDRTRPDPTDSGPPRSKDRTRPDPTDSGPPRSKDRNHLAGRVPLEGNHLAGRVPLVGSVRMSTGDTLSDPRAPILLDAMRVPSPVMGVVIEPETDEDIAKIAQALEQIAIEDPSFHATADPDSGQIVISGMGELHLEIIVERMRREFGVKARVGNPQVAYRETVTRRAEGEHKVERASTRAPGPRGEYGHVQLVVEPTDRGGGYVYENRASTSEIPQEHAPAVEAGVAEAVERGVLAGRPMIDLRVSVVGGSYHPVDSNNYAFKVAGSRAFVEAAHKAAPTVLEPVMALEVVTPEEHVGDVLGDLHARRGKVAGITARPGVQTVACFVPMASMFGYATDLRNRTRGRATYAMELDHYAEVPQQLRDDLIAARA